MKFLITLLFLTVVAYTIRHKQEKLVIPETSQAVFTNQQLQLAQSSFSPLYLHVFELNENGPAKHVNLTDKMKDEVMQIDSFELMEESGISTWVAYLSCDGDDKTYVCELADAFKTKEIKLLN